MLYSLYFKKINIAMLIFLILYFIFYIAIGSAHAGSIPRMVSLRADEVNVRSGPGIRYPIEWIFKRKYMPVEIIAEYDAWRKIRDWEGAEGWIHRAMLTSRRSLIILSDQITIRGQKNNQSSAVARLGKGMVVNIKECQSLWCYINVDAHKGWINRQGTWGLYPEEILN